METFQQWKERIFGRVLVGSGLQKAWDASAANSQAEIDRLRTENHQLRNELTSLRLKEQVAKHKEGRAS